MQNLSFESRLQLQNVKQEPNLDIQAPQKIPRIKRASKHAPMELSSKFPVSRRRTIVDETPLKQTKDPRFDVLATDTATEKDLNRSEHISRQQYSFIKDYQQDEIQLLKTAIPKTKDAEKKAQLNQTLARLKSRVVEAERRQKQQSIKSQWMKEEVKLVKERGKTPYYPKRKDLQRLEMVEEYKKTTNFDKVLEKKRRRNMAKDHKSVPFQRRSSH